MQTPSSYRDKAAELEQVALDMVREIVTKSGKSKTVIAERMGVTRQWVSLLLKGKHALSFRTVARVCEALEVQPTMSLTYSKIS